VTLLQHVAAPAANIQAGHLQRNTFIIHVVKDVQNGDKIQRYQLKYCYKYRLIMGIQISG